MTAPHRKNPYGSISLAIMALGSLTIGSLLATGRVTHPLWHLLATAFQAGLVGGLADWYAVHVLLHPAPWFMRFWPFARHSNLLIRNRAKLEENIVAMVERELLSPDKIWSHLGTHFEQFDVPEPLQLSSERVPWIGRLLDVIREQRLLMPLVDWLDSPATAASLRQSTVKLLAKAQQEENLTSIAGALQSQLDRPAITLYVAQLCGHALEDVIRSGVHDDFVEGVLRDLCQWVATAPAVRQGTRQLIDDSISGYRHKRRSGLQQMLVAVVEHLAINREQAVDSIVGEIESFLNRLELEPGHPLRMQWKTYLLDYACALQRSEEPLVGRFDTLRHQLLANQLHGWVRSLFVWASQQLAEQPANLDKPTVPGESFHQALSWLKTRLRAALEDSQSSFWVALETSATELWIRTAHDPGERQRLSKWAAAQSKQLIESQHHRLGAMVAASLDAYSDEQLIRGIEDKFGPDLQFIRLNGAVLGFLIGLAIGAGSLLLPR